MLPRRLIIAARLGKQFYGTRTLVTWRYPPVSSRNLLINTRWLSFFRPKISAETAVTDIPSSSDVQSTLPSDNCSTLIDQLDLDSVKDFNLLDFLGGNSLVNEYGLFKWYFPASWFRLALEYIHFEQLLPWWLTVMCATVGLRLLMIFVPIASHRLMGRVQLHKAEIDAYKQRIEEAQKNGHFLQAMEARTQLQDFLRGKDIRMGMQFVILLINGSIFMTQYLAVREMSDANFPGFNSGGALWFKDLTSIDPYLLLPLISASTIALIFKMGADSGGSNQGMKPEIQKMIKYFAPLIVFMCSARMPAAIVLYWCTSNIMSLLFAGVFRIPAVREMLKIPTLKKPSNFEKTLGKDIADRIQKSQKKKLVTIEPMKKRFVERVRENG